MPEALTKKMFGLPRWAWLLILAVAVGVGLYLRHQRSKEAEEEVPTEESPTGLVGSEAVPVGGGEGEGGNFFVPEGGGSAGGGSIYEPEYEPPEDQPPSGDTVINIGQPALPSAGDDTGGSGATPETAGVSGNPCGQKPNNVPAGYKAECVSGRWRLAAKSSAKKPNVSTGGGPPDRPNNKTAGKVSNAVVVQGSSGGGGGGGGNPPAQNAQGGTPQNNAQHPAAVNTGNKCVNGGVGGHSAPSGYHLFCQGGWIWRAPNS
jgi:hypothetical protein